MWGSLSGSTLRNLRLEVGMSVAAVAADAGMSASALRRLERAPRVSPDHTMRYLLALDRQLVTYSVLTNHIRSLVEAEWDVMTADRVGYVPELVRARARVTRLVNAHRAAGRRPPGTVAVGYWRSRDEPDLPDPHRLVDEEWDRAERMLVAAHLESGIVSARFCGHSTCRICHQQNGCDELTDGKYHWPGGLAHYVEDHAVRLPAEVVEHMVRDASDPAVGEPEGL